MKAAKADFVFRAENMHVAECGDPPGAVDSAQARFYSGYFRDACGEQWGFVFDRETGQGTLRGGDAEWAKEYPVVKGTISGLVLGAEEILWVQACWAAATGETPEVVSPFTEAVAGIVEAMRPKDPEDGGDRVGPSN